MAKPKPTFEYDAQTLADLSGWELNRIYVDINRGDLNLGSLASVVVWLAANGKPGLRAAQASRLLPAIFGTSGRGQKAQEKLNLMCQSEMLRTVFEGDTAARKSVAKRISKGKLA
jgi:hypothetical protein